MKLRTAALLSILAMAPRSYTQELTLQQYAAEAMDEIAKEQETTLGMKYTRFPKIEIADIPTEESRETAGEYDMKETVRLNQRVIAMPHETEKREKNRSQFGDELLVKPVLAHEMAHFYYKTHLIPRVREYQEYKIPDLVVDEGIANVAEEMAGGVSRDCSWFNEETVIERPITNYLVVPELRMLVGTCTARPLIGQFGPKAVEEMARHPPNERGLTHPYDYQQSVLKRLTIERALAARDARWPEIRMME
jgi:hypothetical protein